MPAAWREEKRSHQEMKKIPQEREKGETEEAGGVKTEMRLFVFLCSFLFTYCVIRTATRVEGEKGEQEGGENRRGEPETRELRGCADARCTSEKRSTLSKC